MKGSSKRKVFPWMAFSLRLKANDHNFFCDFAPR